MSSKPSPVTPAGRPLLKFLESTAPFSKWSAKTQHALALSARREDLNPGEQIQFCAENPDAVCMLTMGVASAAVTVQNGKRHILSYFRPGFMIGLPAAFTNVQPAELLEFSAFTEATVWRMPMATFKTCALADPAMADSIFFLLGTAVRMLIDEVANARLLSARAQIARCLLRAIHSQQLDSSYTLAFGLPKDLTQTHIALLMGLSRQSVGTVLRDFQASGLILLERRRIEVLRPVELNEIACQDDAPRH